MFIRSSLIDDDERNCKGHTHTLHCGRNDGYSRVRYRYIPTRSTYGSTANEVGVMDRQTLWGNFNGGWYSSIVTYMYLT